jgi:hypothetical protein
LRRSVTAFVDGRKLATGDQTRVLVEIPSDMPNDTSTDLWIETCNFCRKNIN